MEFWEWYWSYIKKFLTVRWIKHPATEYFSAIIGTGGLCMGLSIALTPLWLLLVLPVGFTIALHGLWRWREQGVYLSIIQRKKRGGY